MVCLLLIIVGCGPSSTSNELYVSRCQIQCNDAGMNLKPVENGGVKLDGNNVYCNCEKIIIIPRDFSIEGKR